ncbi:hypothetical protein EAS62_25335 [Bradyrhizobium zhanjiangense]|uniref:Uncharacterized protein n=1 Tax=Bradyrhizobium zhanjiangense TaxID=1325107 RepID=A0ABY0DEW5_9BRAD|nr:hypothetical protein EAS62_25335 [Bradyrhizobium zhanjiangense]
MRRLGRWPRPRLRLVSLHDRFVTRAEKRAKKGRALAHPGRAARRAARFAVAWAPALQRTAEEALRCVRGTRLEFYRATASTPSLRAERSNPDCHRGGSLDCFVARAPRNDGV